MLSAAKLESQPRFWLTTFAVAICDQSGKESLRQRQTGSESENRSRFVDTTSVSCRSNVTGRKQEVSLVIYWVLNVPNFYFETPNSFLFNRIIEFKPTETTQSSWLTRFTPRGSVRTRFGASFGFVPGCRRVALRSLVNRHRPLKTKKLGRVSSAAKRGHVCQSCGGT